MTCSLYEFAPGIHWAEETVTSCKGEFVDFIGHPVGATILNHSMRLTPPRFWESMLDSSDWSILGEMAIMPMPPPMSEAENEHVISMKRYVVGERGGRSKNECMTARIRIRPYDIRKQGDAE
jgi:hypothetical protein